MTVAATLDLVLAARAGGYAVPGVNIVDSFSMAGVVQAAEEQRSPVIIQTSVKTVRVVGAVALGAMYRELAGKATVPIALHLDHCPDRSIITLAINSGWSSVLFDASDRDYDTALAETAEVVRQAHSAGVSVESEIENIAGVEDDVGAEQEGRHYDTERLAQFVESTKCDLFAPALGTAHGLYRQRPLLRVDRALGLSAALPTPLVLHGGTGLAVEDFQAFITAGCAKINISTTLKLAYLRALRTGLNEASATGVWDPPKVFDRGVIAVRDDVAAHIGHFGSAGRAI